MKPLLKVMVTLALFFASTFILIKFSGALTVDKIEQWLNAATTVDAIYVGAIVVLLLFADLFIAMPTLTVMILAGYFLGHYWGASYVLFGLVLAGSVGYMISLHYGERLLHFLLKDETERLRAINQFNQHGPVVILLSRAAPILPEVSACMAGITKMPFSKFLTLWLTSCVPYALIATYAGSISTLENPKPAILTALGLTLFFWLAWFWFNKKQQRKAISH